MVAHRIFGCLILLLGALLIPSAISPAVIFAAQEAPQSPPESVSKATAAPVSSAPSAEDDRLGDAVRTPVSAQLVVVGLIGIDERWQVALRDYEHGKTCFLHENETAFGYRVKKITAYSAVLEGAGKEFEVRLGEYISALDLPPASDLPPVHYDMASGPIPDLARMDNTERQQWFEQWQHTLSTLTPEEREAARQQMRDYWRQQWEGGLADLVSTLTLEEQIRIRTKISSYWKE